MNRRQFLHLNATGTLGLLASTSLSLESCQASSLYRLSLAPWSLMRRPYGQKDPEGIDLFDYPLIAKELGFEFVEQDNLHFPGDLPRQEDIIRMKDCCEAAGINSSLLLCGALGDAADADSTKRKEAVRKYQAWIEAASHLGCQFMRVVCADFVSVSNEEKMKYAIDGVSQLVESAAAHNIQLLIENHNGYSSDPDWLVGLIRAIDDPSCGILADFTEWRMNRDPLVLYPDPYRGMEILAPYTRSVGAKSIDFDAEGNETKVDYQRMMRILLAAGFRGIVAVEYFGEHLSRREGITKTKQLLERIHVELASEF